MVCLSENTNFLQVHFLNIKNNREYFDFFTLCSSYEKQINGLSNMWKMYFKIMRDNESNGN